MMFLRPALFAPFPGIALAGLLMMAPGLLSAASSLPLETVIVYDFEDQPLGPIGLGGPDLGQPYWKSSDLDAEVIAFEGGQALQISSEDGGFTGLRFELPDQQGIRDYRARVRLRMMHSEITYQGLGFRGPPTASPSFDTLHVRSAGNFQVTGVDGFPPRNFGSYTAGEPFELLFDMDLYNRTWDIWLNGELEVSNRPINASFATSAGLGRFFFLGSSFYSGAPIVIDEFEIERSQPLPVLLATEFDALPLGAIGNGGPTQGEPIATAPSLLASIEEDASGGQLLTLQRMAWIGPEQPLADWGLLYGAAPSAGLVEADFSLTPRLPGVYVASLHDTDGNAVASIQLNPALDIQLVFPGETPIEVGTAELNEEIRIRLVCHLDQRDCSVGLDDSWVVFNQMFSDSTPDGIAIAGLRTGFMAASPVGARYDLHQVQVLASEVSGLARQMSFIEQPGDIVCGDSQMLSVEVTDLLGNPAEELTMVQLNPDHPDIGPEHLAGTLSFTVAGVATFPSVNVLRRGNDLRLIAAVDDPFNPVSTVSDSFNVLPALPSGAFYLSEPGDGFVGLPLDPMPSLQISDNCGQESVAGREIRLFILDGPAGASLSGNTAFTDEDGQVEFPDLVIDQPGSYRLAAMFEDAGLGGSSSAWFSIEEAPPAAAIFQTQPSTVIATASMTPSVEVYVTNSFDEPAPDGTMVSLSLLEPGSAMLSGASASTLDGVASFDALQISEPGSFQLRASVPGLAGAAEPVSESFDVVAGPAALLSFQSQPTPTTAGATISPTVTVRVTDSNGFNVADGENVTLSLAIAPAGAELLGTVSRTTVGGLASFDDLSLTVSGNYVLDAVLNSGLASSSAMFAISPGDPAQLSFSVPPSDAAVNQALEPAVSIAVSDAYGNPVDDGPTITLSIAEGPAGASLSGATADTVGGHAVFPALSVNQPGSFRLQAQHKTVPVDNQPISDSFNILPGAPATISFTQQPSNINAGASINPAVAVTVTDADGFAVADGTVVSLSLASGPADGELLGVVERTTVDGVASFPGLTIQVTGSYTIEAAAGPAVQAISSAFQVNSSSPHVLSYIDPPGNGVVNQVLMPPVTVEVRDQFDNLVTGSRTIAVSAFEAPGDGSVSGVFADTVDGIATFDSLRFNTPGSWRLRATASGVPIGNRPISDPFEIVAGPPASLEFEQQPSTTVINEPISPPVSVRVLDADGFDVADGTPVGISLASGPAGAALSGSLSQSTSNGLATFADLSIDLAGEYVLQASVDEGAIATTSLSFNLIDTNPASAAFLSEPGTTPVGEIMTPAVAVEVLDGEGGPVADGTAVVLVLVEPGEATISGGLASTTDGVAVFDSLVVSRPGSYRLRAEVSGLDPSARPISALFEIVPGPAASIVIEQQPSDTFAGSIITPAIRVRLLDAFGSTLPDGQSVTVSIFGGPSGAVLSGTTTRVTSDGLAVFDDLLLEQPDSEYALTFSHGELSVISDFFAILADRIFGDRFDQEE